MTEKLKKFLALVCDDKSNWLEKASKRKYKPIVERIPVKIYAKDKEQNLVFCDCILGFESETPIYEKRAFPMYLMDFLRIGELALVCITRQSRRMSIDVLVGEEVVDASLFNTDHLWADLEK